MCDNIMIVCWDTNTFFFALRDLIMLTAVLDNCVFTEVCLAVHSSVATRTAALVAVDSSICTCSSDTRLYVGTHIQVCMHV